LAFQIQQLPSTAPIAIPARRSLMQNTRMRVFPKVDDEPERMVLIEKVLELEKESLSQRKIGLELGAGVSNVSQKRAASFQKRNELGVRTLVGS
jgi:hypothetical protein